MIEDEINVLFHFLKIVLIILVHKSGFLLSKLRLVTPNYR